MVTINFPTIMNPSYPFTETPENTLLTTAMEDGTVKTRARYTRNRTTYTLSWVAMPNAEKETIEYFFKTTTKNGSLPFNWVHPNGTTKQVRFSDVPTFTMNVLRYWRVNITLVEV